MSKSVVLITGASGWLGGLLANELLQDPQTPNLHLILADIIEPTAPADARSITIKADLSDKNSVESLFETEYGCPDTVYALHGIMSRGAEDDFELGLRASKVYVVAQRLLTGKRSISIPYACCSR